MNVTATHCAYEKVFELQTALLEQKSIIVPDQAFRPSFRPLVTPTNESDIDVDLASCVSVGPTSVVDNQNAIN